MDEYVMKQKIQNAYTEPKAPEELIRKVILRAEAVSMGAQAQKQLETAPADQACHLAARVLIGQLATVSELPKGARLEQLTAQLEQAPAFQAALRGGNVARRLSSGELLRQITGKEPAAEQEAPALAVPKKSEPSL